ncbi:MAG: hypothetical protein KGZ68_01095 [Dechloromonas sp.]|nr:hypothetical protein [Dechloromonas sp.]
MKPSPPKPRLRPSSLPWLARVMDYAVRYDCFRNRQMLMDSISDALDGWALRREIADIVKAGIAVEIKLEPGDHTLAGVTWTLTDYGADLFENWKPNTDARP